MLNVRLCPAMCSCSQSEDELRVFGRFVYGIRRLVCIVLGDLLTCFGEFNAWFWEIYLRVIERYFFMLLKVGCMLLRTWLHVIERWVFYCICMVLEDLTTCSWEI